MNKSDKKWYKKWLNYANNALVKPRESKPDKLYNAYNGIKKIDFDNPLLDAPKKYVQMDEGFWVANAKWHLLNDEGLTDEQIKEINSLKTREEVMRYILKPISRD